jgi:PadR family transcriptional regulator, regulatory protein AphA
MASDPSKQLRLTGTSYAVLSLLELSGPATPYDLKQALERSIENFWPVPHTTFYAEPARLAAAGLLTEQQEAGGRRRKLYALTDEGREVLKAWANSPELAPPQLREEGVLKIFAGGDPVPILRTRSEWHRAKLAELEGYLEAVGDEPLWQGVRASLQVGVSYNRMLLDAMESFLDAQPATDAEAATDAQAASNAQPATDAQAATGAQPATDAQAATGSS